MRFLLSSNSGKVALSCPYFMKLALQFPNKLISFLHVSQGAYDTVKFTKNFRSPYRLAAPKTSDLLMHKIPFTLTINLAHQAAWSVVEDPNHANGVCNTQREKSVSG